MQSPLRRFQNVSLAVLGVVANLVVADVRAANIQKAADPSHAVQRPLSDFLLAQGSTSIFIPPLPDFIGWTNNAPQNKFASVDYAGLVAGYLASHGGPVLGTQLGGSVMERPLDDGRAEVTVLLHVTNALTWVVPVPITDIANDPLLFGYRGTDLLANPSLTPALSTCEMKIVFTNPAPGAPLPDLVTAFILGGASPGQELLAVLINAAGSGPLRALAGVPDGTNGRFFLINNGVFHASGKGGTADGFPAEVINLRPAGNAIVSSGGELSRFSAAASAGATPQRTTWGRIKALYR